MHPDIAQALCNFLDSVYDNIEKRGLNALGFKYLSSGSFKRVYASKELGIVVKLVTGDGDREVENYRTAPDHIRPMLVPIIAEYEGLQVQEYLHSGNSLTCKEVDCTANEEYLGNDVCRGFNHLHRMNGTPAIYDYGQYGMWRDIDTCVSNSDRDYERSYEQSEAA